MYERQRVQLHESNGWTVISQRLENEGGGDCWPASLGVTRKFLTGGILPLVENNVPEYVEKTAQELMDAILVPMKGPLFQAFLKRHWQLTKAFRAIEKVRDLAKNYKNC